MTPAERLRAAIDKLEKLRAKSTPRPWIVSPRGRGYQAGEPSGMHIVTSKRYMHIGDPNDAELIVTLHRTIDAQLAILTCALGMPGKVGLRFNPLDHQARAVADAILGDAE